MTVNRNFDDGASWARLIWPALAVVCLLAGLAPRPAHGAGGQCAMILPEGPREVMINTCNVCRSIDILRKRPGNDVPVQRTFLLPPGSRLQVPFLGPGRSRITAELPCKGEDGAPENLVEAPGTVKRKAPDTCVALERGSAGGVALVNRCGACRAALVERKNSATAAGEREAYVLAPRTAMEVTSKGFAKVGLVGDAACK